MVPESQLMSEALRLAKQLCEKGKRALWALKACMNAQEDWQMDRKNKLEVHYTAELAKFDDFMVSLNAFIEKRPRVLKND